MKKNKAFTLAEVLITIGIIGIVASLTIPPLMAANERISTATKLKEFYSVFQQGMKKYMADSGCSDMRCTGLWNGAYTDTSWQNNFKIVIPTIFAGSTISNDISEQRLDLKNSSYTIGITATASYSLANGAIFMAYDGDSGNCVTQPTAIGKLQNFCTRINVDINGANSPNRLGRDYFWFILGNDGLLYPYGGTEFAKIPDGASYESSSCYWKNNDIDYGCGTAGTTTIPSGASGYGCAARIMESNWVIDYY